MKNKQKRRKEKSNLFWIMFFMMTLFIFKNTFFNIYFVESVSMLPNIYPGDLIVVNQSAYGMRLPFQKKPTLQWSLP
ncbi:MAG: S26 family signal peptidase, partial [Silvanigrellaceae bacterium]|nr:S26 family signal peptidase [Silvanigrellaceae bacterium]